MHRNLCLIILLLTGCQMLPAGSRGDESLSLSIPPLWDRYQQCLVENDPDKLLLLIESFEQVMLQGPEPPAWVRSWGGHVTRQPLRTSVDPQALSIACTVRSASLMAEHGRLPEARALYERVISRYSRREWAYYHEQAHEALASLTNSGQAVIALRTNPTPTRTR